MARLRKQKGNRVRFAELFLRWNYMASICWASTSLLILLAFPFSAALISPLLGVNLAGTFSSIVQGITASKASFARTPKVKDRTVVPPFLLLAPYVLIGLAGYTLYRAYVHHLTENLVYAALNVILACYAAKAFIGLRNTVVDTWIHGTSLLSKKRASAPGWARSSAARRNSPSRPTGGTCCSRASPSTSTSRWRACR